MKSAAAESQQHHIWTFHVINKTQVEHNLFHLLPSYYSLLSMGSICCVWKLVCPPPRLHSCSLYFCSPGSSRVSQVLIGTLISRPCAVLISLWFDSLSVPLPPGSAPCSLTCAVQWYFQAVILSRWRAEPSKCSWSCHSSFKYSFLIYDHHFYFFFFPPLKAQTWQTVMCELYCVILSTAQTRSESWFLVLIHLVANFHTFLSLLTSKSRHI